MPTPFLYDPNTIADNIKRIAKEKNIVLKDVLNNVGLGANTFSNMRHGRMPIIDNVAKIADYLDCSVDYLLGRANEAAVENAIELAPEEYPVIVKYRAITEQGRDTVDKLLDELYKNKNASTAYSDERIESILQNSNEMKQLMDALSTMSKDKIIDVIRFVQFQKSLDGPTNE